ncbi:hypothetical protein [Puia dinghuensis]|uniref:Glycosyltransferase RgtA/B/C/D-like domain-containing protein n=1 Tax=Puia dinghuensis TaxID=1792502 RepID=A0A8J2UEL8_9BACT|nr:hypothetical protein [Puia dinghuensis]GGB07000.1 hypothetical protein GCM10011511_33100 [Puia dinghuensis]
MTKKQYYGLFITLGASLLLSLMYCPPVDPEFGDKEFFRYCGRVLLLGQVPYRDFFDHKPPLIYFVNAAGILLGHWGMWIITATLALLVTGLFYRLCCRYRLAFPWLLPLLFNLMLRDNMIAHGINFTREYSTYFIMLFFLTMMSKSRYRHFGMGFFAALTFFMQQEQVLSLAPFLLYLLWEKIPMSIGARLLRLAAGFCAVAIPLLLFFAVHRSLGYLWADAYLINVNWYIQEYKSLGDHFRAIKKIIDGGNYEIPFMVALILGVFSLFLRNQNKPLVLAALGAFLLSLTPEFMGGRTMGLTVFRDMMGYFLPLSATVCIVLFTVFAFTEDPALTDKRIRLPYVFLLCTSLVYTTFQHVAHLSRRNYQKDVEGPVADYLDAQPLKQYDLYVFLEEDFAAMYNQRNLLCPSIYYYQHFWTWYPQWDPGHRILESIAGDLIRHKTTYVFMDSAGFAMMKNKADQDWWLTFMQTHYHRLSVPGKPNSDLWKINEP